jgi:hypothetical protein
VIVKEFAGSSRAEVIDEEVAVVETDTLEKCGPGNNENVRVKITLCSVHLAVFL